MGQPQILIIDDDKDIQETISDILEYEGYAVKTASNGQEALEKLDTWRPQIIFLDLLMPVMNGLQFLSKRRGNPELESIPTIVVSLDSTIDEQAMKMGASGYIRKPLQLSTLLETLKIFIGRQHAHHVPTN